jgi:hypothetical protein
MATLLRSVPLTNEPKLVNRFFLEFPKELSIESYLVQTTTRPKINIEKTAIPYFNTESYVAARYKWDEITIQFIDLIGPSTSQKLMEWVRLHSESLTGRMGYANGYKKDLSLTTADPTGISVEKWVLYETQIVSANFDKFDYSGSELVKPEIVIQPYYCELSY